MTFEGPLAASAYEVLGVAASASDDDLRRAYRLRLRETHPDTGGDASLFIRVQQAWEHLGTASAREAYDPAVVRQAPWEARRMLAAALAEESTAAAIADLGIGFTAWNDVVVGADAAQKLDHAVLGPSGLYGLASDDFGDTVRFRQGEVIGRAVGGSTPVADLLDRIRRMSRVSRVRFAGAILILPDDDLDEPVTVLGSVRGVLVAVVRRSALRTVLRSGIPGARPLGVTEAFDVRTRLAQTARVLVP